MTVGLNIIYAPTNVNCLSLYESVPYSVLEAKATLQAKYTDLDSMLHVDLNKDLPRDGYYQCYCKYGLNQYEDITTYADYPQQGDTLMEDFVHNTVCNLFKNQTMTFSAGWFITLLGSYTIIIIGMLLRMMLIYLAKQIGFFLVSAETSFIMLSVSYTLLFNFAIVPFMALWSVREFVTHEFFTDYLFRNGLYTDLNSAWFQEIGGVICAYMLSNAWWPIIEMSYMWAITQAYRALD